MSLSLSRPLARVRSARLLTASVRQQSMDTEHTQVFRPSRIRVVGLLLVSAAIVACGIFMGSVGQQLGWLAIAFFGLGVVVFALKLLPSCSYVRVGPDGFTVRSLFRSRSCRWSDVDVFKVAQLRRQQMVVFSFASHTEVLGA